MANSPINVIFSREYPKLKSAVDILSSKRFKVTACPLFDIKAVEKTAQLRTDFAQVLTSDYLIFTSQYAVTETLEYLKSMGINSAQLSALKICVVGPVVARQLTKYGLKADLMPELYTAESLAELFSPVTDQAQQIFFPKGNRAALKLEQVLTKKGYNVVSLIIYKTELRCRLDSHTQMLFDNNSVDCFAFTSPSSVQALMAILTNAEQQKTLANTIICAIGTTTYQACLAAGLTVNIMPDEYTVKGLASAIDRFYMITNDT